MLRTIYLEDIGNGKLELVYYLGYGFDNRISTGNIYHTSYIESLFSENLKIVKNKQTIYTYSVLYSSIEDFEKALLEEIKKLAIKEEKEKRNNKSSDSYFTIVFKIESSTEWSFITTSSPHKANDLSKFESYILLDNNWCDLKHIIQFIKQTEKIDLIILREIYE